MTLGDLQRLVRARDDAGALRALADLQPAREELPAAAALALHLGRPSLAARWWARASELGEGDAQSARLGLAAAQCRRGLGQDALRTLSGAADSARAAVLRARALSFSRPDEAEGAAHVAVSSARREGDAPALIAAVTLLGETLLARGEGREALLALAEGLKVAEMTGAEADAHLLAVLAHAQLQVGSARKAHATAEKALARSAPRSPARVLALRALGRSADAEKEAEAGELPAA